MVGEGENRVARIAIHEIFYDDEKQPIAHTTEPISLSTFDYQDPEEPFTDEVAIEAMRETLEWLLKALNEPILNSETDFSHKWPF